MTLTVPEPSATRIQEFLAAGKTDQIALMISA